MFEWLEANPTYLDHFNAYMAARRVEFTSWIDLLPPDHTPISGASPDPSAAFIVDVGSGRGHDLTRLLATHPNLPGRAILQDLPRTIAENRRRGTTTPFEMMPHDFFTPQPIKGKLPRSPSSPATHPLPLLPPTHPHPQAPASTTSTPSSTTSPTPPACAFLAHLAAAMTSGYSPLVVSEIVLPETGARSFRLSWICR